ncbi:MAG: exonuclease domain-containing protein [Planctomycetota bacterium]|nr:exonuclease domain-containing protein [Planctomycetota bacterium]MDA1114327.1 exonuclease domain-containing protein [Planctomycetota bacterium]
MALPREFVVFDTETTGMPPGARLLEIGALKVRGQHVVDRFEALVYPECPIPPAVIRIHGIRDRDVKDAETAEVVLPAFLKWVKQAPLVGHNVRFDATVLAAEAARYGLDLPDNDTLCTLKASRKLLKRPSHALQALVKELGLPAAAHHRALADAEHTLNLMFKMEMMFGNEFRTSSMSTGKTLNAHSVEPPLGSPQTGILQNAIADGVPVQITYRLQSGSVFRTLVSPRLLYKSSRQGWMEALCHEAGFYKSYRLDRVLGARAEPDAPPASPRRIHAI